VHAQYNSLTDLQWEIIKECLPIQRNDKYGLCNITDEILK